MPLHENTRIFTLLNRERIRYCHWKSNANLSRSFESKADFDLLIDRRDSERFHLCLQKLGLKRRYSTAEKVYPGMEDYLGFDERSGDMIHLHVHFKLVVGRKNRKNYRIPIEEQVLESSVCDNEYPIRIIVPELELILLIIRSMLKVDFGVKTVAKTILNRGIFPSNVLKEFMFLKKRIDEDMFCDYTMRLFPEVTDLLRHIAGGNLSHLSYYHVLRFQRRIITALRPFRLFSNRELAGEVSMRRLSSRRSRSWLAQGGISVAFVGVDGSGKSSMVSEIKRWLGWKLSVRSAYMGLPRNNVLWKIINTLTRITNRARIPIIKEHLDFLKWMYVVKVRHKIYRYCEMLKNQGNIVVFDRFPLKEFWDMDQPMDGPRLGHSRRWKDVELERYDQLKYPDYIFVLKVDEAQSIQRKKEQNSERKLRLIRKKTRAVDKLTEIRDDRFIIIDTSKGQEQTLMEVKTKLWELL